MQPDPKILQQLVKQKMPFGKYKREPLSDLPIGYLEWFKRNGGFPNSKLGEMLENVYVIKLNGLEKILKRLKKDRM